MIIKGSSLKIIDNSGAKWSKCIKVVGKSLVGKTGSLILVTLSSFVNRKKVKKRTLYLGLIAGVKFWSFRLDGSFFRFLLDKLCMTLKSFTEVYPSNIQYKVVRPHVDAPGLRKAHNSLFIII